MPKTRRSVAAPHPPQKPIAPPRPTPIPPSDKPAAREGSRPRVELPFRMPADATAAIIRTYEAELTTNPDPARRARLLHELGWIHEHGTLDLEAAIKAYERALAVDPDHGPSLRDARRANLSLGRTDPALALLDREVKITPRPEARAALLFEKGFWLESRGKVGEAREAYQGSLELDAKNVAALKGLVRLAHDEQRWLDLAIAFERLASVSGDPAHRAAITVQRAFLLESRLKRPDVAADLYLAALELDADAAFALEALIRLHSAAGRHADLATALELYADRTTEPEARAAALYLAAHTYADRLGNVPEAVALLGKALEATPRNPLALEELITLLDRSGQRAELAAALTRLADLSADPQTSASALHRAGQLYAELDRPDDALAAFGRALALAPAHVPTLHAIEPLLRAKGSWAELVRIWTAEAESSIPPERKARVHARIAQVSETELGALDQALEHYDRALALAPDHEASFKSLARLYATQGKHRDLVRILERAIDSTTSTPRKIAYLFRVGATQEHGLGDPAQAMLAYARVLKLDPQHLGAMHAMQQAAEQAGKHLELVDAIAMEVEHTRDKALRVDLLTKAGDVALDRLDKADLALVHYKKALAENPAHPAALAGLGRAYYKVGRWDALLEVYAHDLASTPQGLPRAELLYKMGELCEERLRRVEDAIRHYRGANEASPGHAPSLTALHRILGERNAWDELGQVLESMAAAQLDQNARAISLYRAGLLYEEKMQRPDRAAKAYEASVAASPAYRPAREALSRVREAVAAWALLDEHLGEEIAAADPQHAAALTLFRGQLARHRLDDPKRAAERYQTLRESGDSSVRVAALTALELLYGEQKRTRELVDVYRSEQGAIADPAMKAAALLELARHQIADESLGEPKATLLELLDLSNADPVAASLLEHLALLQGDAATLARVDRLLGAAALDPRIAAEHLTRLGTYQETADPKAAIDTYRMALMKYPEHLPAIRALGRMPEKAAIAEAYRREASLTRLPKHAANLLVREADLWLENNDAERAIPSLVRAIEICPEHDAAAQRLTQVLGDRREHLKLVDLLANAANAAIDPTRVAALWSDVADIHLNRLNDPGSAVTALRRALESSPDDLVTLLQLGDLYAHAHQWKEAAPLFERAAGLTEDRPVKVRAQSQLARAQVQLEQLDAAEKTVRALLALEPDHPEGLGQLSDLRARRGELDGALEAAQRMAKVTEGPARAPAFVRVAAIERQRGNREASEAALCRAIAVEGPVGEAGNQLRRVLDQPGVAKAYADALSVFVTSAVPDRAGAGFLELARLQGDVLGMGGTAVDTLRRGLAATGGDALLAAQLAKRLSGSGNYDQAIVAMRDILDSDVTNASLWRELATALERAGRTKQARHTIAPIVVLGAATSEELAMHVRGAPALEPGALGGETLTRIGDEGLLAHVATRVLGATVDAIPKLYPRSFEEIGVPAATRIGARDMDPMRITVNALGNAFGARDIELYVHDAATPTIALLPTSPPTIVVSRHIQSLPDAQQTFLVARLVAAIAGRFHTVECLTAEELDLALAAVGNTASPTFGTDRFDAELLSQAGQRVRKATGWLARRPLDDLAAAYVASPLGDVEDWALGLRSAATRAAALATGDLPACIEALRYVGGATSGGRTADFIRQNAMASDLMSFWSSDRAMAVRSETGMT